MNHQEGAKDLDPGEQTWLEGCGGCGMGVVSEQTETRAWP